MSIGCGRRPFGSMVVTGRACAPDKDTASKKSQASRTSAGERRKSAHVMEARFGAGSMPASLRISHTFVTVRKASRNSTANNHPAATASHATTSTRSAKTSTLKDRAKRLCQAGGEARIWGPPEGSYCLQGPLALGSQRGSSAGLRPTAGPPPSGTSPCCRPKIAA